MNKDQFMGKWKELKGKIKEKWGKLTDDDISQINGRWDQLSGKLQQKYGWNKEHAEREMNAWCSTCEHREMRHGRNESDEEKSTRGYKEEPSQWERGKKGEEKISHGEWEQGRDNEKKFYNKDENKDKKRKTG